MAKLANTFTTANAVGNRESLSDVVSRITPEDTPIYSMIKKTKISSVEPNWETDVLATPAANIHPEGNEFSFSATTPPSRLKNHTQIFSKSWIVSDTQEASDNAGKVEKVKHQKLKKGVEIRKDVEFALLDSNASVAGETRELGSLSTWYTSNVSRGASGANGGYNSGTGLTAAATNGTQRAFTKTLLDTTMQSVYESGGNLRIASVSPYVKTVFTTFMSDSNVASFRYATAGGKSNTIVATADVYEGDFGKLMIVPNRVQGTNTTVARNVHLLDPSMVNVGTYRKIHNVKGLAKNSDATTGVVLGEMTLCVKNEAGLGVVADVFGKTAST